MLALCTEDTQAWFWLKCGCNSNRIGVHKVSLLSSWGIRSRAYKLALALLLVSCFLSFERLNCCLLVDLYAWQKADSALSAYRVAPLYVSQLDAYTSSSLWPEPLSNDRGICQQWSVFAPWSVVLGWCSQLLVTDRYFKPHFDSQLDTIVLPARRNVAIWKTKQDGSAQSALVSLTDFQVWQI